MLTRMDNGATNQVDVAGKLTVDYGCGIGPKIVLARNGMMAVVNQSESNRSAIIYRVNVK